MPKSGQVWDAHFLTGAPLFRPFERLAAPLRGREFPDVAALTHLCENERVRRAPDERTLRFVWAEKKPRRKKRSEVVLDRLYDGSIALRGEVPCYTQSYHDLFNAIAFAAFPRSKRALHARQFQALLRWVDESATRVPGKRTREQDALTIFDEGGVVLAMTAAEAREFQEATVASRYTPGQAGMTALLFGHALVEHLYEGHLAIRAAAMVCVVPPNLHDGELLDAVDEVLVDKIRDPAQFRAPGGDGIFEMKRDGTCIFKKSSDRSRAPHQHGGEPSTPECTSAR